MSELDGGATLAEEPVILDTPADEPQTMEDTMRATLADIREREAGGETTEAAPTRERGADGKFLPKAAPVAPVGVVGATPADPAPVEAAPAFEDKGPPASYRPAAKAQWDNLTPELKQEIYKREEDIHKGIEQYRGKAQVADILWSQIQPHLAVIQAAGTDIPTAVGSLFQAATSLQLGTQAQKLATLGSIARQFGVDVSAYQPSDGGEVASVDPGIQAAHGRIAQLEGYIHQMVSQQQNSTVTDAVGQIEQFSRDPAHKYFADVRADMGVLMQTGRATSLKDAYDKACRLNDSVRTAIDGETKAAETKARQKAADDARKRGAQSLKSNPLPGTAHVVTGTMEDTLRAKFQEIQSRG